VQNQLGDAIVVRERAAADIDVVVVVVVGERAAADVDVVVTRGGGGGGRREDRR